MALTPEQEKTLAWFADNFTKEELEFALNQVAADEAVRINKKRIFGQEANYFGDDQDLIKKREEARAVNIKMMEKHDAMTRCPWKLKDLISGITRKQMTDWAK